MVKIITDTTSCLPTDIANRFNIPVIPQIITFGQDSYYEGSQMDIDTFMERLKNSGELPKTAAPPPELFIEQFKKLVPDGEPILCIHPSKEISGTVRSASVAIKDFPDAYIRVIDTRTIASPLGTMVQLAVEWAEQGQDVDTIVKKLESMINRSRIYFLVPSLEFLARGGRIGGASALFGSILQIKPILTIRRGKVDQYERERTYKRAVGRLKNIVLEQSPRDGSGYLSVMHADVPQDGMALADELSRTTKQEHVPIFNMPPAIVTHAGPGILGVGFFVKQ